VQWRNSGDDSAQPAARSIANNGVSDLLARRISHAQLRIPVTTRIHLQDKPRRGEGLPPSRRTKKFRAPRQSIYSGPHHPLS
jgi:hypothetical protein